MPNVPVPHVPSASKVVDLRPGDATEYLEVLTTCIEIAEENDFPELVKLFNVESRKLIQKERDERNTLPWNRNFVATALLPAIESSATAPAGAMAKDAALKAALSVEEKFIALPAEERTQTAEVAAIEEVLAVDTFNGQPMKFRVDDEGYKIYSVGPDGKDENGPDGKTNKDYGVWIKRKLCRPAK